MSADLTATYLGFTLRSPIVASCGPHTGRIDNLLRLEEAGIGAVVLPSLFEEQVEYDAWAIDDLFAAGTNAFGEALTYLPGTEVEVGATRQLALVEEARDKLSVPVIASLNGVSPGGWLRYARYLEEAGAQALELNLYDVITDPDVTAATVEDRYVEVITEIKNQVDIPLSVKLSPWLTAPANVAKRLVEAGADGLVLFNRFFHPQIDPETMEVRANLQLSRPEDARLPLQWIGVLYGQLGCSLGATSGVHSPLDVIRLILAGADVAMTTSAVLEKGPGFITTLERGVQRWLDEHEYVSVHQATGSVSMLNVPDPRVYERLNYVQTLRRVVDHTDAVVPRAGFAAR